LVFITYLTQGVISVFLRTLQTFFKTKLKLTLCWTKQDIMETCGEWGFSCTNS